MTPRHVVLVIIGFLMVQGGRQIPKQPDKAAAVPNVQQAAPKKK